MLVSNIQIAITDTIDLIRSKSKRSRADLIINMVSEKLGLNETEIRNEFDVLKESKLIFNRPMVRRLDSVELEEPETRRFK